MRERAEAMSTTQTSGGTAKNDRAAAETDPAVISQNIENTREDMTETLDAIQQRLEPEHVTEYVKDVAHHVILEVKAAVLDLAGQAREAIREGADKKKDESAASTGPGGQAKQKAGQAAGQMQEKVGHMGEQMQGKAGQMQHQTEGLWQKLQANPIAIGALGVAVGTVIGAIVPETEKENQLMGETRDRVIGSVQDVAGQTIDSAKEVAKETGDTVMKEAKSQGL